MKAQDMFSLFKRNGDSMARVDLCPFSITRKKAVEPPM
jgi:hypothetical protein